MNKIKFPSTSLTNLPLLFALLVGLSSCGVYSFTGAKLSPGVETIVVENFNNNAAGGPPNMSRTLTEKMKEYYQQNSALKIANTDGDLRLEGTIVGYTLTPEAPIASTSPNEPDRAALNRLTIRVKARYTNTKDDTQNFDQEFSFFKNFPQEQSLSDVENQIVPIILDQIVLDIFSKSLANW